MRRAGPPPGMAAAGSGGSGAVQRPPARCPPAGFPAPAALPGKAAGQGSFFPPPSPVSGSWGPAEGCRYPAERAPPPTGRPRRSLPGPERLSALPFWRKRPGTAAHRPPRRKKAGSVWAGAHRARRPAPRSAGCRRERSGPSRRRPWPWSRTKAAGSAAGLPRESGH